MSNIGPINIMRGITATSGPIPAYALNLLSGSLDTSLTFSRASNATMYDSTGTLVYAPANMFLNSATLSTQSVTVVSGQSYTISFYGTGSVTGTGGWTGTLSGTGVSNQVFVSFTASSTSVTFTVSGSVTSAQLEPTSYSSPLPYNPTTSAAYYGPRFDYNPSTLALNGLLVEQQSTNMAHPSLPSTWTLTGITRTNNDGTAPDGTNTAVYIVDTGASTHTIVPAATVSFTSGTTYTQSLFVKPAGQTVIQLDMNSTNFGVSQYANFILTGAGSFGSVVGVTATIQSLPNGWYRCSITGTATSTSSAATVVAVLVNNNSSATRQPSYTGTSTGLYVWGGQMEASTFATSHIPTYTLSVTRLADQITNTSIPWFNTTSGTFFVEGIAEGLDTTARNVLEFSDGSSVNMLNVTTGITDLLGVSQNISSAHTALGNSASAITVGNAFKVGVGYTSGANIGSYSGTSAGAGTMAAAGTPAASINQFVLGAGFAVAPQFNGWFRNLTYYNTNLGQTQTNTIAGSL